MDAFKVDTGSLYPALHRLAKQKLIAAAWKTSANQQRICVLPPHGEGARRAGIGPLAVGAPRRGHGRHPLVAAGRRAMKFWRRTDDVDAEIDGHIEMAVRDRMERGESRAQAEAAVRREFGSVVVVKEVIRDMDGRVWLTRLGQDLRYAARLLHRSPVSPALPSSRSRSASARLPRSSRSSTRGPAANAAPSRGRGSSPTSASPTRTAFAATGSPPTIRSTTRCSSRSAASSRDSRTSPPGALPRSTSRTAARCVPRGVSSSREHFSTCSASRRWPGGSSRAPTTRRAVRHGSYSPARSGWQGSGGDPRAVGRTLTLDSHQAEVIGVTPAGFTGLEVGRGFDVAVPLCVDSAINRPVDRLVSAADWWLVAIGRLKPGWTLQRATAQLQAISPGIFETTITPTYPPAGVARYKAFMLEAAPGDAGVSMLREASRASALDAARGGGHRPADRVRQSRKPPACARQRAAP